MSVVKTNMGAFFHLIADGKPCDTVLSAQVLLFVACHCVFLRRNDMLLNGSQKPPDLLKGD
jgi:hypothetical protein